MENKYLLMAQYWAETLNVGMNTFSYDLSEFSIIVALHDIY